MGNKLNTNLLEPKQWDELNENIKFPTKGKLIVPISKLIIEVCELRKQNDINDISTYTSIYIAKNFLTKYPIVFSFTKKCYKVLLDILNDEEVYLICKFIKENTPKKYIHWNYREFKIKLKFKKKYKQKYCLREKIEKMNEIFTKN